MKNLQISEANARKLYKTAMPEFKQTLEDTFGKEYFTADITERIKTYEDACAEIGEEPINEAALLAVGFTPDEIALRKLKIVTKALNEGHMMDLMNTDERKWIPWFDLSSGFVVDGTDYYCSNASAGRTSRLCFKSEKLAEYAGRQFIDLYKEFML